VVRPEIFLKTKVGPASEKVENHWSIVKLFEGLSQLALFCNSIAWFVNAPVPSANVQNSIC